MQRDLPSLAAIFHKLSAPGRRRDERAWASGIGAANWRKCSRKQRKTGMTPLI